jgi:hypothetical protein
VAKKGAFGAKATVAVRCAWKMGGMAKAQLCAVDSFVVDAATMVKPSNSPAPRSAHVVWLSVQHGRQVGRVQAIYVVLAVLRECNLPPRRVQAGGGEKRESELPKP